MYQILIDGKKYGHYSIYASPAQTAIKMGKRIYQARGLKGAQKIKVDFVLNRTLKLGDDKHYSYWVSVIPIPDLEYTRDEIAQMLNTNPQQVENMAKTNKGLASYLKKYRIIINGKHILKKYIIESEKA